MPGMMSGGFAKPNDVEKFITGGYAPVNEAAKDIPFNSTLIYENKGDLAMNDVPGNPEASVRPVPATQSDVSPTTQTQATPYASRDVQETLLAVSTIGRGIAGQIATQDPAEGPKEIRNCRSPSLEEIADVKKAMTDPDYLRNKITHEANLAHQQRFEI